MSPWPLLRAGLFGSLASLAFADGPGLGNLSYPAAERFDVIAELRSPRGHGASTMVNGYFMTIFSSDGGGKSSDGGIDFWDLSDPRAPRLAARYDNKITHQLRESHGFGLATIGDRTLLAAQAVNGFQIWDVTDPLKVTHVSTTRLPGIYEGDYSGAWWLYWQAPYLYLAGTDNGLYVIDTSDVENPILKRRISTNELGGINPSVVMAFGNLLVGMESLTGRLFSMDISHPLSPQLIDLYEGKTGYSFTFTGHHVITSGGDLGIGGKGDRAAMYVHSLSDQGKFSYVGGAGKGLLDGGYGSYQDGQFLSGFSDTVASFDVATLTQQAVADVGREGSDQDFATVLGNVVFVSDDHGTGSSFVVNSREPDRTPPSIVEINPGDGARGLSINSRIGIAFTDQINLTSLNTNTFALTDQRGELVSGTFSRQGHLVNFAPARPLRASTAYTIRINEVLDLAGNASVEFGSSFETGAQTESQVQDRCRIVPLPPAEKGTWIDFVAEGVGNTNGARVRWDFGDGKRGAKGRHRYRKSGRFPVRLTVEREDQLRTCSTVQIIRAERDGSPVHSSPMVYAFDHVFVVNPDNNSLTVLDDNFPGYKFKCEIGVGVSPQTVAEAPNKFVWVTNDVSHHIVVVHPNSCRWYDTIPFRKGTRPYGVVFAPDQKSAFVTMQGTGELVKLDPTGEIVGRLYLGPRVKGVSVSADSRRVYVSQFISQGDHGVVYEVDAKSMRLKRKIALPYDRGPDTEASGRGLPNYLGPLVISPDGRDGMVTGQKVNVGRGLFMDGSPLTFESTVRPMVSSVNLKRGRERLGLRNDLNDRALPLELAYSPFGDIYFVAVAGSNVVEVYETGTNRHLSSLPTSAAPTSLAVKPDGSRLFVKNYLARSVSVFDTLDLTHGISNSAALIREIPTVQSEKLAPAVLRGKRTFYDASNPRMSRDGYLSCAVCHLDGGHDGQVWDFTQRGEGLRNTISLLGKAGMGQGRLHWTANFDELQDFENEIRDEFGGRGFLTDEDFLAGRTDPLGVPKAGLSAELDDLAAYMTSLTVPPRSPHRQADGTLSDDAALGRRVFSALNCQRCHSGSGFSDGLRHDVGTLRPGSGNGMSTSLEGEGIDTPGLSGIWTTAPYFHHGQARTLREVLEVFDHGGALAASDDQLDQLVAFLNTIDQYEKGISSRRDEDFDDDGVLDNADCAPLDPDTAACEQQ